MYCYYELENPSDILSMRVYADMLDDKCLKQLQRVIYDKRKHNVK